MSKAVKAVRCLNYTEILKAGKEPGSFAYYTTGVNPPKFIGIEFICPCGCGSLGSVNFDPIRKAPCWTLTGTLDKPTVRASIHQLNCGWHGFLTDGVFKKC